MASKTVVKWMTMSIEADARKRASFSCSKCGGSVEVSAPLKLDPVPAPCQKCGTKHLLDGKKGGDLDR